MLQYGILLLCVSGALAKYRIIGGSDALITSHSHQVSLQLVAEGCTTAGDGYCHICGASIISDNWVLTAAHCVEGRTAADFVIGAEFNTGLVRGETYKRVPVDSIYMHPNYNNGAGAFPNDVAILKLSSSIDLVNSNQRAIALAQAGDNSNGQSCVISGWGLTSGTGEQIPDRLQEASGSVNGGCLAWALLGNYNSAAHICFSGASSSGSCNGDSGGPMVCGGKLAGVTSWGAAGCSTTFPSVYARVSTYKEWIETTMSANQ